MVRYLLAFALTVPLAAQPASVAPPTDRQVEAVFTDEAPRIDGHLDELLWDRVEPVARSRRSGPTPAQPSTEATEVRIAYDRDHLYFAFTNLDANRRADPRQEPRARRAQRPRRPRLHRARHLPRRPQRVPVRDERARHPGRRDRH